MGNFVYENSVTGKNFVGRKDELAIMANLLAQGENVCIYELPKSGRHSFVNQVFFNLKVSSHRFSVVNLSLLNVRSESDFVLRLGSEVLKIFCNEPLEFEQAVGSYLSGSHFVFDRKVYEDKGLALSLNWDLSDDDIRKVLALPYAIAADRDSRVFVVIDEFQNVMLTEDGDKLCKIMSGVFGELDQSARLHAGYLLMGGGVNAMKDIFAVRKLFYRQVEHVAMPPVEERLALDYLLRGFMSGGKVVERDQLEGAYKLFRGNMWYLNHFAAICDNLSKGFMTDVVLTEALNTLVSIHEPRFIAVMNDLTTFQVNMMKAILDGHVKFSSAEVIRRYGLNSSANVRRLKDALCKKELVTFDSDDKPVILDPLFEYWLGKKFFEN